MEIAQIYTPNIAQCSYVIGSGDKCVVVDPVRDIGPCLEKAKEFKMEIVAVLETHLHADFVSGHMELAEKTGAPIYAPQAARCSFPHHPLADGEELTIGGLNFQLMETPGHTPDCAVYLVTDLERGDDPVLAFTGDTLLVGDVGRPDLFPGREEELAGQLFGSLKRLKALPGHVEIYPAHGMGSFCGRALSAKLWSTIGTEARYNEAFKQTDPEAFKKILLTGMPPAPDHFARCSEINRLGPPLLKEKAAPRSLKALETAEALKNGKTLLDTRPYLSFAAAHIPGALSISHHGNLATFAGWLIPPGEELILLLEHKNDLQKVQTNLYHVGLDNIAGYLDGGMENWISAGLPAEHIETISVHRLRGWMQNGSPPVLDTRMEGEWKKEHIEGTSLAPTPDIRHRYTEWDAEEPIIVLCNTSNRSMTAASLLKQRGFKRVINALGGTTAWAASGYPMLSGAAGSNDAAVPGTGAPGEFP